LQLAERGTPCRRRAGTDFQFVLIFGGHCVAILVHRRIMLELLRDDYLSHFENLKGKTTMTMFVFVLLRTVCARACACFSHRFRRLWVRRAQEFVGMFVIFLRQADW